MNTTEALNILRQHNAWRRGDDESIEQVEPKLVGQAIDFAISALSAASAEQQPKVIEFIDHLINGVFEGADWDGGSLQDLAVQYGLLKNVEMQAPCSDEGCQCAQMEADFPAICYRKTYLNTSAPQASQPTKLEGIEQYRMQMAGISTAAIGYWKEGDDIHPDYDTVALRDVAKLYAKYDELFKAQASQPVALTDALRRSGANTDHHGLIAFTPEQLKTFAALLSATSGCEAGTTSQPSAWDQAIEAAVKVCERHIPTADVFTQNLIAGYIRALRQQAPAVQELHKDYCQGCCKVHAGADCSPEDRAETDARLVDGERLAAYRNSNAFAQLDACCKTGALIGFEHACAVIRNTAQPVPERDREVDRARFADPQFNKWLDEAISDAGHTVWDQISDVASAWAGWTNRSLYSSWDRLRWQKLDFDYNDKDGIRTFHVEAYDAGLAASPEAHAAPAQQAQEDVTWMDVAREHEGRYRVEHKAFGCFDVKCGTGTRTLYSTKFGRRDAELVAAELTTAFHDGIHVALRQQAPAVQRPTWKTDGGWKCLNCGKSLIDHEGQRFCPAPAQTGEAE